MKYITRKITISIMTLFIILVIFGTTAYAWVELSRFGNVGDISMEMGSSDGFDISIDGVNYYKTIPTSELQAKLTNLNFKDITTIDGKTFQTGDTVLSPLTDAISNQDYISFDVWFRSDRRFNEIYLIDMIKDTNRDMYSKITNGEDIDGSFIISKGLTWRAAAAFQNGPDQTDIVDVGTIASYYCADAMRLSIVPITISDTGEELSVKDNGTIIDMTNNTSRGYGLEYGQYDYFYKRTGVKLPVAPIRTTNEETTLSNVTGYVADNKNSFVTNLTEQVTTPEGMKYYIGKATINIWVEGWDVDCFDAILFDSIIVKLKFRLAGANIQQS